MATPTATCTGKITIPSTGISYGTYLYNLQTYPGFTYSGTTISLNTANADTYPPSSNPIHTSGLDAGQSLYGWYLISSNSSYGTVALTYPYTTSSGPSVTMKWIRSGPYSSFTISATAAYGHSFNSWRLGSASGTVYSTSATVSVSYTDTNLTSYCQLWAVFV